MKWLNESIYFCTCSAYLETRRPKLHCKLLAFYAKGKAYLEEGQVLFPIIDVTHTAYPNVQCFEETMLQQFASITDSEFVCTGVEVVNVGTRPMHIGSRLKRSGTATFSTGKGQRTIHNKQRFSHLQYLSLV